MRYKDFDALRARVQDMKETPVCAVVCAEEDHVIDSVVLAARDGIIKPILIGNEPKIRTLLAGNEDVVLDIIHKETKEDAVNAAIELVKVGKVQVLMKGLIETSTFMRAVLKSENNLKTGGIVSMLSLRTMGKYHKLIGFADAGICPHPTLEQKKSIIEECTRTMENLGIDCPKVAVLCSSEQVSDKSPESLEAAELKKMNQEGLIKGCIVEGPISFDLATNPESAKIKGFDSPVAGDADLLLFPTLTAANVAAKMASFLTGDPSGVIMTGTKIPVIVTSRASAVNTKQLSILMAALQTITAK